VIKDKAYIPNGTESAIEQVYAYPPPLTRPSCCQKKTDLNEGSFYFSLRCCEHCRVNPTQNLLKRMAKFMQPAVEEMTMRQRIIVCPVIQNEGK